MEIIRIALQHRPADPLIRYTPPPRSLEQLFASLTLPQAERLMTVGAQAMRDGNTVLADDVARLLAAFTDFRLDTMLETWIDLDRYWPALAFRAAGKAIRERILDALGYRSVNANHALQAAAWIGDSAVVRAFTDFDCAPPAWTKGLYIPPSGYARTAGWEVTAARRELTLERCFSIIPGAPNAATEGVSLFQPTQDRCAWCGNTLVNLLKVDATASAFGCFESSGPGFAVTTCYLCTCFGTIFAELDELGQGHWSLENLPPSFLPVDKTWDPGPWATVPIALSPRRAMHAADIFLPTTFSQIGGQPAWVQDCAYPNCCKCGRTMVFIAQVDNGQFPGYEGMYYAFLCRNCHVTATVYQQT